MKEIFSYEERRIMELVCLCSQAGFPEIAQSSGLIDLAANVRLRKIESYQCRLEPSLTVQVLLAHSRKFELNPDKALQPHVFEEITNDTPDCGMCQSELQQCEICKCIACVVCYPRPGTCRQAPP